MNRQERITAYPQICHGKPCVAGTRVPVSVVVDNLNAGVSREEILRSYPSLREADIDSCIAYAVELNSEHGTNSKPDHD